MVAVTKLIDILNKPFLVKWANKIGLEGTGLKEYRKKSSSDGTAKHNQLEQYFLNGTKFKGYEKLEKSMQGFQVIGVEQDVNNGYITGRVDLILKKNDLNYICDFKSSNRIYLSTKLQLSSYKHMYGADKVCYINLDELSIKELDINTQPYWDIMRHLYVINDIMNQINERL